MEKNKLSAFLILGVFIIISLIYYSVNIYYIYIVVYLWFGIAYGMFFQYGRFCLVSAFRDLFGLGVTRMFAGLIIGIVIFSFIMAIFEGVDKSTFYPAPIGVFKAVGGLIFGIGMVMAGGCATGTLYKCGEGNGTSMLALLAMCISQALFVNVAGLFDRYMTGYIYNLPQYMISDFLENIKPPFNYILGNSVLNTLLPGILLLIVVYIIWGRSVMIKKMLEEEHRNNGEKKIAFKDEVKGFWMMLASSKRTAIAGLLLGIFAGLHLWFIDTLRMSFEIDNFGELLVRMGHTSDVNSSGAIYDPGLMYISTSEAQLGAWIFSKFGINLSDNIFFKGVAVPAPLRNPVLLMAIGIIFGSTIMALWHREFRFRIPKGEFILWGLIGGTLMGFGARVGLGCNIGAFFMKVAGGDPGGWIFGAGLAAGAYFTVKFFDWWTTRQLSALDDF